MTFNNKWHRVATKPAELVMSLLSQQAIKSRVNLLTGTFNPNLHSVSTGAYGKSSDCSLFAGGGDRHPTSLEGSAIQVQAEAYRTESERIFEAYFRISSVFRRSATLSAR